MHNSRLNVLVRHIHRLAGVDAAAPTDGQLLDRFLRGGEEMAFAELVRRHGPMVFGVCRRVLRDGHAAEDAFQATFLVLFRRARALDRSRSLANWLYTVAYHAALRARGARARRQQREREIEAMSRPAFPTDKTWRDLQPILDEELSRLPDRYRAAVVLCHLQGKTCAEAGRLLGCATGTVKSRLARGREMLRERLTRRGVTLTAGGLGLLLTAHASAAVPAVLLESTLQATLSLAAGGIVPAAALAEGVLKTMLLTKLKITAVVVTVLGLVGGAGVIGYQSTAAAPPAEVGWQDDPAFQPPRAISPPPPAAETTVGKPAVLAGHTRAVKSIAFSPDGNTLASASLDGMVRLWDTATGKQMNELRGHAGWVHAVAFSPEGRWIASAGQDGSVRLWPVGPEVADAAVIRGSRPDVPIYSVTFSPDGRMLAVGDGRGEIRIYDRASNNIRATAKACAGPVRSLAFAPDGKLLAAASPGDGAVKMFDASSVREARRLSAGEPTQGEPTQGIECIVFAPNGRNLVAGCADKSLAFWDVETGKLVEVFVGSTRSVLSISFSPDGRYFVVATGEPWITLYDIQGRWTDGPKRARMTGKRLETGDPEEAVVAAVFSPRGGIIASASRGRTNDDAKHSVIRLWDVTESTGDRPTRPSVLGVIPYVGEVFTFPAGGAPNGPQTPAAKPTDKQERRFTFELRNKPWNSVFDWLTDQTGLPVMNNYKLAGTFTFVPPPGKTYTMSELLDIVNESLRGQQYELLQRKNSILVAPSDEVSANVPGGVAVVRASLRVEAVFGGLIDDLVKNRRGDDAQTVDALYLAALGRFPREQEKKSLLDGLARASNRGTELRHVMLALMDSKEYAARLAAMTKPDVRVGN